MCGGIDCTGDYSACDAACLKKLIANPQSGSGQACPQSPSPCTASQDACVALPWWLSSPCGPLLVKGQVVDFQNPMLPANMQIAGISCNTGLVAWQATYPDEKHENGNAFYSTLSGSNQAFAACIPDDAVPLAPVSAVTPTKSSSLVLHIARPKCVTRVCCPGWS